MREERIFMKKLIRSIQSKKQITNDGIPFVMDYKNGRIIAPPNAKVALVDNPLTSDFANVLIVSNHEYKDNEEPIPPIVFCTEIPTPKWDREYMEHIINCCEKAEPELHKIRDIEVLENNGHYYTGNDAKTLQDFLASPHILAYALHGELPDGYRIIFDNPDAEAHVDQLYDKAIWD